MTDKYAKLREAAEKATPGPWLVKTTDEWADGFDFFEGPDGAFVFPVDLDAQDAAYIAAANPQTILALLDALAAEKARADVTEAAVVEQSQREEDAVASYERQQATIATLTAELDALKRERDEARMALKLAEGRLTLLLSAYPEDSDVCDHPTATRYVLSRVSEALEPFARLVTPAKPTGNAGAYSIRFADIERARSALTNANAAEREGN